MDSRAHVFIYGDVIGVGFRFWTERNAESLGLTGWVRNATRRRVEAVFEGEKEKVEEMVEKCHKGPGVSWVEKVEVKWEKFIGEYSGFEIQY